MLFLAQLLTDNPISHKMKSSMLSVLLGSYLYLLIDEQYQIFYFFFLPTCYREKKIPFFKLNYAVLNKELSVKNDFFFFPF